MDITPKYIKMCEQAMKYLGKPKKFYIPFFDIEKPDIIPMGLYLKKCIPLYTQDQLQEMLRETHSMNPCNLLMFLHQNLFADFECPDYVDDKGPCEGCKQEGLYWRKTFNTLEQVWLAFVMDEKYNRIWDSEKEEWVKKGK